jgi:hypothetical protein
MLVAGKETDKTKYMVVSRGQNARQIYITIDNSSSERVEQFRCLGNTLTNQNSIQKEIESRLKSGYYCCHSVENIFSSSLLSKNMRIEVSRTIIFPVVLCGCENWSLTLREVRRLRVRIKGGEYLSLIGARYQGTGGDCIMRA